MGVGLDPISREARAQAAPDVLFSQVGDEAVLLNLGSGVYYSLDAIGTKVWAGIARGERLGDIHEALFTEFSADSEVIWADLAALITDLTAKGLIQIVRAGASLGSDEE